MVFGVIQMLNKDIFNNGIMGGVKVPTLVLWFHLFDSCKRVSETRTHSNDKLVLVSGIEFKTQIWLYTD